MNKGTALFIFSTILLLIAACRKVETFTVAEVSKPEVFTLHSEGTPNQLSIQLQGHLDGNFQVQLSGTDTSHHKLVRFREGRVDTSWRMEWQSTICTIIYIPESVMNGELEIGARID